MKSFHFNNLIAYADGSWTPQRAGAGIILMDSSRKLVHIENRIVDARDNNEAEYSGLLLGLGAAIRLGADLLEIRMDSEVIIKQMTGSYAVRSNRLKHWHWRACQLAMELSKVHYVHIPRENNALADALAGEASAGREWQMGVR